MTKRPSFTPWTAKRPSSARSTVSVGRPAAASAALNSANVVPGAGRPGLHPGQLSRPVALRVPQTGLEQAARRVEDRGAQLVPWATNWWASDSVKQLMAALDDAYTEA